jgi:prephenate dehydrogenase
MTSPSLRFDDEDSFTIAIIGFGAFGQLLARLLLEHTDAQLFIVSSQKHTSSNSRMSFVAMKEISQSNLVIPCVPISAFETTIHNIASLIQRNTVIMDICSVKTVPVHHMKRLLPQGTQIIATHPMFGPDSVRITGGVKGLRMMIHNATATPKTFLRVKQFFSSLGIQIITMTPLEHDKAMAWSLGYSYLIGKIGQRVKIKKTPIDTFDFELLLQNKGIMQTYNPYASVVQKKVTATLSAILKTIDQKRKNML